MLRAQRYNNLAWVKHDVFIERLLAAGDFKRSDIVLEVGAGTGIIARLVSPMVHYVYAIDSSSDMLGKADGARNVSYYQYDARKLPYTEQFDKVIARYVMHHITDGVENAMSECHRVLKKGGRMIFAEGVPPSDRTKQDYIEIFKLKENRLTFMPDDMVKMMKDAGFSQVTIETLSLKQMSVRNWLENSDLDSLTQEIIYKMHTEAPRYFKHDYNMVITNGDCLIDMKIAITTGIK